MSDQERCPHCGRYLHPDRRITYTFSRWTTTLIVGIISMMIFALDFVDDGPGSMRMSRISWSTWVVLGLWIIYISVQLIRHAPYYEWLMIPISGILLSIFLFGLDRGTGKNSGYAKLDWAWYAILPIFTFIVIVPIAARIARQQPTHYDRLEYLVDYLSEEQV